MRVSRRVCSRVIPLSYWNLGTAARGAVIARAVRAVVASVSGTTEVSIAGDHTCRAGSQRGRDFSAARSEPAPQTYCNHHGRQRPLGAPPPPAARGRTPRWSDIRTLDGGNGGADWHSGPHFVRVLRRELEKTTPERSGLPHGIVMPLSEG